jgi:methylmalonyl-CoA/ethylmalonyl-CoA epimerase
MPTISQFLTCSHLIISGDSRGAALPGALIALAATDNRKEPSMTPVQAVNHIGIAVRSIDAQRPFYEGALGAVFEGVEDVPDQKVRVGFFRIGDVRLELLEPTEPASTVAAFLEKRGEGLHHIALTVAGIEDRIAELKQSGVRVIDEAPRPGAHHMRIAFLHPKSTFGVLTELCEPADAAAQ